MPDARDPRPTQNPENAQIPEIAHKFPHTERTRGGNRRPAVAWWRLPPLCWGFEDHAKRIHGEEGVIVAALALALAPAPVYVEAVVGSDPASIGTEASGTRSLREQLMLRLLEEGYPLAPSADRATRTLRVEATSDGIRVEARGEDTRTFEVATGAVLPLEAVHRAMEALDEVTPRAEPTGAPTRRHALHVEVGPSAGASPEALRGRLVGELLARHITVVPADAAPDAVLCAEERGDALALSRAADVEGCRADPRGSQRVALQQAEPDPAALQASLDALLAAPTEAPLLEIEALEPANGPTTPGLTTPRTPASSDRRLALRVGARTGIYGRLTAADAAVGASLRVGGEPGPGALLDVLMVPASAPNISIFETSVSGGFGWMFALSRVVGLHLQALGGVQVHRFRQRGADPGHRVDWTAELPVGVSLRVARGLQIDLSVRGGRSGRAREHREDDVVVWSRSAWRIGGSVGLSYGWRPR